MCDRAAKLRKRSLKPPRQRNGDRDQRRDPVARKRTIRGVRPQETPSPTGNHARTQGWTRLCRLQRGRHRLHDRLGPPAMNDGSRGPHERQCTMHAAQRDRPTWSAPLQKTPRPRDRESRPRTVSDPGPPAPRALNNARAGPSLNGPLVGELPARTSRRHLTPLRRHPRAPASPHVSGASERSGRPEARRAAWIRVQRDRSGTVKQANPRRIASSRTGRGSSGAPGKQRPPPTCRSLSRAHARQRVVRGAGAKSPPGIPQPLWRRPARSSCASKPKPTTKTPSWRRARTAIVGTRPP